MPKEQNATIRAGSNKAIVQPAPMPTAPKGNPLENFRNPTGATQYPGITPVDSLWDSPPIDRVNMSNTPDPSVSSILGEPSAPPEASGLRSSAGQVQQEMVYVNKLLGHPNPTIARAAAQKMGQLQQHWNYLKSMGSNMPSGVKGLMGLFSPAGIVENELLNRTVGSGAMDAIAAPQKQFELIQQQLVEQGRT